MNLLLLVAEDDAGVRNLLEITLEDEGFELVLAGSANAAIAELNSDASRFQCVITDVNLRHELTGWDVARRARELVPEMPVIYISGHREPSGPLKECRIASWSKSRSCRAS